MTTPYIYAGSTTNILIAKEGATTYGTQAGTIAQSIGGHIQNFSLVVKNSMEAIGSVGSRATQQVVAKNYDVTGSIDYMYTNGRLIAYALGTDTVTGTYTHTLAKADVLSSFSMLVSADSTNDIVTTVTGCAVDKLRFSADVNSPLSITADYIAQSTSTNTVSVGTFASDAADTVMAPQFAPTTADVVKVGGVSVGELQSFEFSLDNNLQGVHQIGARIIQYPVAKRRLMTWRMSVILDSTVGIELFKELTGTGSAPYTPTTSDVGTKTIVVSFTNNGASTALRSITFNCTGYKPDEMTFGSTVDGLTTLEVSGLITDFDTNPIVCIDGNSANYIV